MANTTNLNLAKPAGTDKALVSVLNSNSDKIDAWAGTTNQALSNLGNKVAMYAATINFGGSNAVKFTRSVQHQNFIVDVSSYSGSPGYIVASNGALSNFSLTAKAAWNSDQTQLTVVSSTYRRCLVLSDSPITYELLNADYSSFVDNSSFNLSNVDLKDDPSGPFLLLSNDINNTTSDISLKLEKVPRAFAITLTKYGENPTVTIKKGNTVLCTFYPTTADNCWGQQTRPVTGINIRETLTISVTWANSYSGNSGHYNLFAIY